MKSVSRGQQQPGPGLGSTGGWSVFQLSVTFLDTKNYRVSSDESVVLSLMNGRRFSWVFCARRDHTQICRFAGPYRVIHPNAVFSFKKELFPFSHISSLPARERQFHHQAGVLPSASFPAGVVGNAGCDGCPGPLPDPWLTF